MMVTDLPMLQGPFQDNLRGVPADLLRNALHDEVLQDRVLHVFCLQPLRAQRAVALQDTEPSELCV